MGTAFHSAARGALALWLPLLTNAALAAGCITLFGQAVGWNAAARGVYPPWLGNGLPFLQFVALAYLVDRSFRLLTRTIVPPPPPGFTLDSATCGWTIPYRWILAALVAIVSVTAIINRSPRKPN
jgi:hypothetical protein